MDDAFLQRLADELDKQADDRRERAITADAQRRGGHVPDEEVDRWAASFATAYQTLRGIAAAIRAARDQSHGG